MFSMIVIGLLLGLVVAWAAEGALLRKLLGDASWACRCALTPITWRLWQYRKSLVIWMALSCDNGIAWMLDSQDVCVLGVSLS